MSSWGTRRRNKILAIIAILFIAISLTVLFFSIDLTATCFDGRRNGDEQGIDCGGSCDLYCRGQAVDPLVHWARQFEIVPGLYNAIAYVENQNASAGADNVKYTFKLFDRNNVLLTEKTSFINIRPKEIIPIVESGLNTGKLEASRASFDFEGEIVWQKRAPRDRNLVIGRERIFEVEGLPRITAELTNISLQRIKDVEIIVIVYDSDGNAISTSSTLVTDIDKNQTADLIYTWPSPFIRPASRFEIIPLYESIK